MGTRFRLCFELTPVEDIAPWVTLVPADPIKGLPSLAGLQSASSGSDPHLSWYTLTHGQYWLSTPLGEVLRYTQDLVRGWELDFSLRYLPDRTTCAGHAKGFSSGAGAHSFRPCSYRFRSHLVRQKCVENGAEI